MANATVFINKHSGRVSALDLKALREEIDGLLKARGVEANFVVEDCTSLIEAVDQCRPDTDYYIVIGGDGTIAALRDAFNEHSILVFRDQDISDDAQIAFSERFGPLEQMLIGSQGAGTPIAILSNVDPATDRIIPPDDKRMVRNICNEMWHTDSPFLEEPPSITTLRQVEGPPYGGDTTWTNTALAFRHLSKVYQDMLRPLKVWMSARNNFATQNLLREGGAIQFGDPEKHEQGIRGTVHPLIRTHPHTGEPSLYICDTYAAGIDGMTTHEAKPLIDFLVQHPTQHAFTCRLRWEPGMVCMWDNAATMHLGPNDYDGFRREMYRTTIAGGVPV